MTETNKIKLQFRYFKRTLETNSKDNPFNIDKYDKQSVLDCKLNNNFGHFYVTFTCADCNKIVSKDMYHFDRCTIDYISYCKMCKAKRTNMKRFGVEYSMQSKEIQEKSRKTCKEHFGVEHPLQSKELMQKFENTMLERHGVRYVAESKELMDKITNTNMERYGNRSSLHGTNQVKTEQIFIEKFGVDNPYKAQEVIDKIKAIRIERYGTMNNFHIYKYDNIYFDSSWELAFYIYHVDHGHNIVHEPCNFSYGCSDDEKKHSYFPDFKVGNRYYEIKGEHFIIRYKNGNIRTLTDPFGDNDELSNAKYRCMKQHKVNIIDHKKIQKYLDYIDKKYGKNYLQTFEITRIENEENNDI